MKIYINEGSFGFDMSPLEKINLISSSSFSGVGFWFEKIDIWLQQKNSDLKKLKFALQNKNIDVIEVNFLKFLFTHKYESKELQHEISQGIYYAKQFGAPFITAATFGKKIQPSMFIENIKKLSEKLRHDNLSLAIEFLPWTEIPSITELQKYLNIIDKDNVGILLDTAHFFMGDPDLNSLKKVKPEKIFLIHCNDIINNPFLFSKLSLIEITRGYRVAPGLGDFPLILLFKTLLEMGVNAPVSLEVLNKDSASSSHIDSVLKSYTSMLHIIGA